MPVTIRAQGRRCPAISSGPLCETSDTLGSNRTLPHPQVGERLALLDAGAYGAAMASNYNRRPMPAEVLVDDGRWRVIRRRQTIDDMLPSRTDRRGLRRTSQATIHAIHRDYWRSCA